MRVTPQTGTAPQAREPEVTVRSALRTWAYVGVNSFGGPAGHIAVMHREVVERRRWVSERRFMHALNTCMLLPGPEAMQLATYLGWLMHGVRGAAMAGGLFILPGFVTMLVLSIVYALFGSLPWVAALLTGLQAAVIVLVVQALFRISRRTLVSPLLVGIAVTSFVGVFAFGIPFPVIVLASGVLGWLAVTLPALPEAAPGKGTTATTPTTLTDHDVIDPFAARRARWAALGCLALWLAPVVAIVVALGTGNVFAQLAWLMSKAAVLTFGGAYAILGYVAEEAVDHYGWLSADQMATGLGLAETTPGPLVMVLEYVGFMAAYASSAGLPALLAGVLGAALAVWVTFLPAFMFVFLAAPFAERLRGNRSVSGALAAISAAVCGVILDLALWFAAHVLFASGAERSLGPLQAFIPDLLTVRWTMVAVVGVAAVLVLRVPRLPTLVLLAASAGLGLLLDLGVSLQS